MNLHKVLLSLYPRWWRERYGAEFLALLEDVPLSPRAVLDTLAAACDARLQPTRPPMRAPEVRRAEPQPEPQPEQEPKPEPSEPRVQRRGLGPIEHELGIDRVIRDAIERGDFDNLPGAGKPLDLSTYDVHNEWRLAYDVVKQSGETLPWIALGKDIELLRDGLQQLLELASAECARGFDADARQRRRAAYLDQVRRLDAVIVQYNNQVPLVRLQQLRTPSRVAEQRFDSAWPRSHLE